MMNRRTGVFVGVAASAGVMVSVLAGEARADINGFNGLAGWQYNQGDAAAPATYDAVTDTLRLTNRAGGERRSVFFETPQNITNFSASFTYQVSYSGGPSNFGAAFVIQNSAAGAAALGAGTGSYGYGGITNSLAISLELPSSRTGFYTNGAIGGGSLPTTPVSLPAGRMVNVNITYDGRFFNLTLLDPVGMTGFNTNFLAPNLGSIIGSDTAFIGFTASTNIPGFGSGADQFFSNVRFTSVPSPGAVGVLLLAGPASLRRRR